MIESIGIYTLIGIITGILTGITGSSGVIVVVPTIVFGSIVYRIIITAMNIIPPLVPSVPVIIPIGRLIIKPRM